MKNEDMQKNNRQNGNSARRIPQGPGFAAPGRDMAVAACYAYFLFYPALQRQQFYRSPGPGRPRTKVATYRELTTLSGTLQAEIKCLENALNVLGFDVDNIHEDIEKDNVGTQDLGQLRKYIGAYYARPGTKAAAKAKKLQERGRDAYLRLIVERYPPHGADGETQLCVSTPF